MDARGKDNLYNDGFDIGLCSIDLKKGDLSFAGASLPLLLVRENEVQLIDGDVLPLGDGYFKRSNGYRNHEVKLQAGNGSFLFSDGTIHQFGGESGRKKFSMKKLIELLQQTSDMSLPGIKDHTENAFQE